MYKLVLVYIRINFLFISILKRLINTKANPTRL